MLISALLIVLSGFALNAQAWPVDVRLVEHSPRNHKNDVAMFYTKLNNFLHKRDVIGLSSREVKDWLGEPYKFSERRLELLKKINVQIPLEKAGFASVYYRIPRDTDEQCFHVIRFKLHNDKVVQWSILNNMDETIPITTNVVIVFDKCGSVLFQGSNGFRYPQTVAKSEMKTRPSRSDDPRYQRMINLPEELGKIEGPRDKNLFNVDPPVLDQRLYK
jgi:hypothetical protein